MIEDSSDKITIDGSKGRGYREEVIQMGNMGTRPTAVAVVCQHPAALTGRSTNTEFVGSAVASCWNGVLPYTSGVSVSIFSIITSITVTYAESCKRSPGCTTYRSYRQYVTKSFVSSLLKALKPHIWGLPGPLPQSWHTLWNGSWGLRPR